MFKLQKLFPDLSPNQNGSQTLNSFPSEKEAVAAWEAYKKHDPNAQVRVCDNLLGQVVVETHN